jgi:hypothetical protein
MNDGPFKAILERARERGMEADLADVSVREALADRLCGAVSEVKDAADVEELIEQLQYLLKIDPEHLHIQAALLTALVGILRVDQPLPRLYWLLEQLRPLPMELTARMRELVSARLEALEDDPHNQAGLKLERARRILAEAKAQDGDDYLAKIWDVYSESGDDESQSLLLAHLTPLLSKIALELRENEPAALVIDPPDLIRAGLLGLQVALDSLRGQEYQDFEDFARRLARESMVMRAQRPT